MKEPECENCPFAWEDMSYEGECNDCGCMWYDSKKKDYGVACYLPKWIKRKIAAYKKKKNDEAEARAYDDVGEWYEEEQRKDKAFREALKKEIFHNCWAGELFLCYKGDDGLFHEHDLSMESIGLARMTYEELLEKEADKA